MKYSISHIEICTCYECKTYRKALIQMQNLNKEFKFFATLAIVCLMLIILILIL